MMEAESQKLLVVEDLCKEYLSRQKKNGQHRTVKAVDHASFSVLRGETFGIVGESGCGKTTLGKCVVRLHEPTSGSMYFDKDGSMQDILKLSREDSFQMRQKLQIVFQDPYASLNPMHNILEAFDEPLRIHGFGGKARRKEIVAEMLRTVNLQPDYMYRYPHEFSGGQRQRICIAKALALKPDLIVCDEPVSALDVSIQAQVINMFAELQEKFGLTYLFIAHDLLVVRHISDRIAVMYLGKMVELANANEIYDHPLHPYSKSLLSAVPVPDPKIARANQRIVLSGDIPSPLNAPSGCPFRTRCPYACDKCAESMPDFQEVSAGHFVACHRVGEIN